MGSRPGRGSKAAWLVRGTRLRAARPSSRRTDGCTHGRAVQASPSGGLGAQACFITDRSSFLDCHWTLPPFVVQATETRIVKRPGSTVAPGSIRRLRLRASGSAASGAAAATACEGVVGHLVDFGGATELTQLGGDGCRFIGRGEDAHGGLAAGQFRADALPVRVGKLQTLVVEVAEDATTDEAHEQRGRSHDRQDQADTGAGLGAALAQLVLLDLAVLVDDEHTDGAELHVRARLVPRLQCSDSGIRCGLVGEDPQDQFVGSHFDRSSAPKNATHRAVRTANGCVEAVNAEPTAYAPVGARYALPDDPVRAGIAGGRPGARWCRTVSATAEPSGESGSQMPVPGGLTLRSRMRQLLDRRDDFGVVLVLIVITILSLAILGGSPFGLDFSAALEGITLLIVLHTSGIGHRGMVVATVAAGCAVIGVILVVADVTPSIAQAASASVGLALVVVAPVVILWRTIRSQMITFRLVLGALCIYLLIGLAFNYVFALLTFTSGQPFFAQTVVTTVGDLLYFSYTTLTTVGFGDLTAAASPGRMAAVTEALMGQLYLVSAVAILVSRVGRRPPPVDQPSGPGDSGDV